MRWGLLLLGCSACGRIGFAPHVDATDGDAPFPTGPFGPPMTISALNSNVEDDDVSLTGDMLEIYFGSVRSGTSAVWRSVRGSVDEPWSPPVEVVELGVVNNPRVSLDGLTFYCSFNNDIHYAKRADRGLPWSPLQILPGAATPGDDLEPWLDADELVLYLTTYPVTGPNGIARAQRASTSEPFGPLVLIPELSTSSYDGGAWVREDERLLLYHSETPGSRDIFISTRATTADPWGTPVEMTEINSSATDSDVWLSPDGHTIYFVSRQTGNDDIYMATR